MLCRAEPRTKEKQVKDLRGPRVPWLWPGDLRGSGGLCGVGLGVHQGLIPSLNSSLSEPLNLIGTM